MEDDEENPWGEEPSWAKDDADEKGEEDGDDDRDSFHGAQHVIMLVDCRASMFVPQNDGKSPMDSALMACEELLRLKVHNVATQKTGKRDGVGFLLYGCTKKQQSIQALLPLEPPGVQHIKDIRQYTQGKKSLKDEYGTEEDAGTDDSVSFLRTALHEAIKTFVQSKCVKKQGPSDKGAPDAKSVWIFTNNDDPCAENKEEREHVLRVAKDAMEHGLEVHLWPLSTTFDADKFYNSILTEAVPSGDVDQELLKDRIHREWRKVRKTFSCPLLLPDWRDKPDDPGIMLDFYRTIQSQQKPQAVTIHQQTKRETEKVTQTIDKETGEVLKDSRGAPQAGKSRLETCFEFASKTVLVSKDETAAIKKQSNNCQDASLVLLGFKPKASVPLHYALEKSYFIYPNEGVITGSTAAFANLHASMLRKQVCFIGELLTKATATSRLVAVFPQEEEVLAEEDGGTLDTPPGMVAIVLPFEDDVRALDKEPGEVEPTEESISAAVDLMKRMTFPDVDFEYDFKNDALQNFWGYIESVALETNLAAPTASATQLDEAAVRKIAGDQIDAFNSSLPEDIVARKASKKRKIEPDANGEYDWVGLYKAGDIPKCTVTILKEYLKSKGARLSGKKDEVVARVEELIAEDIEGEPEQKARRLES